MPTQACTEIRTCDKRCDYRGMFDGGELCYCLSPKHILPVPKDKRCMFNLNYKIPTKEEVKDLIGDIEQRQP